MARFKRVNPCGGMIWISYRCFLYETYKNLWNLYIFLYVPRIWYIFLYFLYFLRGSSGDMPKICIQSGRRPSSLKVRTGSGGRDFYSGFTYTWVAKKKLCCSVYMYIHTYIHTYIHIYIYAIHLLLFFRFGLLRCSFILSLDFTTKNMKETWGIARASLWQLLVQIRLQDA